MIDDPLRQLWLAIQTVKRRCPELALWPVVWLQMKHPVHPVQAELLRESQPMPGLRLRDEFRRLSSFCVCLLYGVYYSLRLIPMKCGLRQISARLARSPVDLVIKSWCFEVGLIPGERDFYYGDLQRQMERRGVSTLMLSGNPSGNGFQQLKTARASIDPLKQLPELSLVPLTAPIRFAFWQMAASLRLRRLASQETDFLVKRVAHRASRDCLEPQMIGAGIYYWIGRSVAKTWRPRALLTLYEGYGWEQLLWLGVRSIDPSCKAIGYQHTVLFRHNLDLLQPEALRRVEPDAVLCLGPRTQSMLSSGHSRSRLYPFGTFRKNGRGENQPPQPSRRRILILPEGYLDETALLFNCALGAAALMPTHQFVLRHHPALSRRDIEKVLRPGLALLRNVRWSNQRSIESDFAESSLSLYRGSSSVLYAVPFGLKLIYLRQPGVRDIDPLFELESWKETAESAADLCEIVRRYESMPVEKLHDQWRSAVEYVESYAVAAGTSSFEQLLGLLNEQRSRAGAAA